MKYCKDCKYYQAGHLSIESCTSPNRETSLVTGKHITMWCAAARNSKDFCSASAKWFEPKEEPEPIPSKTKLDRLKDFLMKGSTLSRGPN